MSSYTDEIARLEEQVAFLKEQERIEMSQQPVPEPSPKAETKDIPYVTDDFEDEREAQMFADMAKLRAKYAMGKIPKLNRMERGILEFCHERDMKEFVKEEMTEHPIVLNEDGSLKYSWYRDPKNLDNQPE